MNTQGRPSAAFPPVDPDARLRDLLERHSHRWLGVAYVACGDRHYAEDALNEALFALVQAWRNEAVIADVEAWVANVIRNRAVDRLRRECSQHRLIVELTRLASENQTGSPSTPEVFADEDREAIHIMMRPLSERQRAVVHLRLQEGLSHGEIADRLDCAESRIRAVFAEAIRVMRMEISK